MGNIITDVVVPPSNDSLKYDWPATNRSGRKVGPGTYMVIVRILQDDVMVLEEKVMVGIQKQ